MTKPWSKMELLPDFHDLSRETLLVIASPDLLLLPMALIERGEGDGPAVRRRLLWAPPLYWRSPLIAGLGRWREPERGMEGEQKIELTIRSFILRFKITSDPPMDRPSGG